MAGETIGAAPSIARAATADPTDLRQLIRWSMGIVMMNANKSSMNVDTNR